MDCEDNSDEYQCKQIKIDNNSYIKEYVPRHPNGKQKLRVEVSFDVREIVEVNEPQVR